MTWKTREEREAERREDFESWVRCLDVERAAGDLIDEEYDAERRRYAAAFGIVDYRPTTTPSSELSSFSLNICPNS